MQWEGEKGGRERRECDLRGGGEREGEMGRGEGVRGGMEREEK